MPFMKLADNRPKYCALVLTGPAIDPNEEMQTVKTTAPQWKTVFTVLVLSIAVITIVSLPHTKEALPGKAGVVITITALLWCTEAVPLMITALVPVILFPFAGVVSSKDLSAVYFNDISMLMLGTFLIAESVETSGLHKRIALGVLSLVGRSEALLMLGSMLVTWKLSMFISNTATTAMMLPIIGAIIESLRKIQADLGRRGTDFQMEEVLENEASEPSTEVMEEEGEDSNEGKERGVNIQDTAQFKWFCKGLILSIPYGASIGGIATLTGTPPNLVFKAAFETAFPNAPTIDFAKWISFSYPISLLVVLFGWHILVLMYAWRSYLDMILNIGRFFYKLITWGKEVGPETKETKKWRKVNSEIRIQYKALGNLRFPEIVILFLVACLVFLWLLRDPSGMVGWGARHLLDMVEFDHADKPSPYLSDAWIVILVGIMMFIIPRSNPLAGIWLWKPPPGKKFERSEKLLDMDIVMKKTPWDVLILLGGGYAIAHGCKESGLSEVLGKSFMFLKGQEPVVIALVVCIMVAILTEVASNTASTSLLMPILASMSQSLKLNPLYLMISGTIAASLAFCLPSATAPNALVFTFKEIRVIDMLRTGVIMNIASVLLVVLGVSTWSKGILGITDTFPDWAADGN